MVRSVQKPALDERLQGAATRLTGDKGEAQRIGGQCQTHV